MRMSHKEERVNGDRIRHELERAPPHLLNPLGWMRADLMLAMQRQTMPAAKTADNSNTNHQRTLAS